MIPPVEPRRGPSLGAVDPISPAQPAAAYARFVHREDRAGLAYISVERNWREALKRIARGASAIVSAVQDADEAVNAVRSVHEAAWMKRLVVCSEPEAIAGIASPGAPLGSFTLEVLAAAAAQTSRSKSLPKHVQAVTGTGTFTFSIRCRGLHRSLSVTIEPGDTNAALLGKLRDAVNRSDLDILAAVAELPESSLEPSAALELRARHSGSLNAFHAEDEEGGVLAAIEHRDSVIPAANALYRINGGALTQSERSVISLSGGAVKLQLKAPSTGAVAVAVVLDHAAIVGQLKQLVRTLNTFVSRFEQHGSYLNDELMSGLIHALQSSSARQLGVVLAETQIDRITLDESKLQSLLDSDPEAVVRELRETDGLPGRLARHFRTFADLPPEQLLRPAARTMQAYSAYPWGLQTYWQIPMNGWVMNREW